MSFQDYQAGKRFQINAINTKARTGADPFRSLIMAAFRISLRNQEEFNKLKDAFPEIHAEFIKRVNTVRGELPED